MSGDEEPSFNPRSWVRRSANLSDQPGPPIKAPDVCRRGLLLVGIPIVLAVAAGGVWQGLRGRSRNPAKTAGPSAKSTVPAGVLSRSLVIKRPGDLGEALIAAGTAPGVAAQVARAAELALAEGAGDLRITLSLAPGPPPRLLRAELRRVDGSGVLLAVGAGDRVTASTLATDLNTQIKVVRGEMDANSFYSSAVAAGVTDSLISDFANAFTFDFDFQREIRPGDIFEAAFERRVNGAGEAVGAERLVYASLQTQAKSKALYRFVPPGERVATWFDGNGSSIIRSLMRTPVEGARISSSFGPRMHPVLGYTRVHKGTDFATPIGAKVYASGDGVIDFVGVHGGHGNYISISHTKTLQTAYAHLSSYGRGIAVGAPVRQGQEIALSGNTGLSSGPHLHYEVIVGGAQVDPMTYETESGRRLQGLTLAAFQKERDRIDALRAAQNG